MPVIQQYYVYIKAANKVAVLLEFLTGSAVDNDSTATANCSLSFSATCSNAEQENIYSNSNVDDVSFEQQNLEIYICSKKCYTL